MKIGIVGAGCVGLTLLRVLKRQGYEIEALYSRNHVRTAELGAQLNVYAAPDLAAAAKRCDVLLLTVPDRHISDVAEQLAELPLDWRGRYVYHCSGAQSSESLAAVQRAGAECGSMHPLQTFPSPDMSVDRLVGAYFAIDGSGLAQERAAELVRSMGGLVLTIPAEQRAVYHAAACASCNYLAALLHMSENMLRACGVEAVAARQAVKPLVEATWSNILAQGSAAALTGPIVRGDVGTVEKHIAALAKAAPAELELYRALGRYTTQLAANERGLSQQSAAELIDVLVADRAEK